MNKKNKLIYFILLLAFLLYGIRVAFGVADFIKLESFSRIPSSEQLSTNHFKLGLYPLPINCDLETPEFDANGVVVVDYSKSVIQNLDSIEYNPGTIAQYGLCFYNKYIITSSEDYRKSFITQINWLMKNNEVDTKHQAVWWRHDFEVPQHGVNYTGWVSGLTQGVAISALLRGYELTGQQDYLSIAEKAANSFAVPLEEGGFSYIKDGDLFFEEMPSGNHILNGDIFALFGIHEYWVVTNSLSADQLALANIATLKKWLPQYDLGFWSRYSLDKETLKNHWTIASPGYHDLHIDMMEELYTLTGDPYFESIKAKWQDDQRSYPAIIIGASRVIYSDFQLVSKKIQTIF